MAEQRGQGPRGEQKGSGTWQNDGFNRATATTDPNGLRRETDYDALDRVIETRVCKVGDPQSDDCSSAISAVLMTVQARNLYGDVEVVTLPAGNVREYAYDAVGRVETMDTQPDVATETERVHYEYDVAGQRTDEIHQEWTGSQYEDRSHTRWEYDGCRLESMMNPWGGAGGPSLITTSYGYDVQDHLTSVTDAEGNVTTYVYSDRDLLTSETSPVAGTTTHAYDDHGDLRRTVDARAVQTDRTTDAAGRVTSVSYPTSSLDVTYAYDQGLNGLGRLSSITRNGASLVYGYDDLGRMVQDGDLGYDYDPTLRRANGETTETADRPLAGDHGLSMATASRSPIPPAWSPTTASTSPIARRR